MPCWSTAICPTIAVQLLWRHSKSLWITKTKQQTLNANSRTSALVSLSAQCCSHHPSTPLLRQASEPVRYHHNAIQDEPGLQVASGGKSANETLQRLQGSKQSVSQPTATVTLAIPVWPRDSLTDLWGLTLNMEPIRGSILKKKKRLLTQSSIS